MDDYKIKPLHIILSKTCAFVKSYDGETKWMYFSIKNDDSVEVTDFHDKEMPEVGSSYACLSVILIDFVLKKDKITICKYF